MQPGCFARERANDVTASYIHKPSNAPSEHTKTHRSWMGALARDPAALRVASASLPRRAVAAPAPLRATAVATAAVATAVATAAVATAAVATAAVATAAEWRCATTSKTDVASDRRAASHTTARALRLTAVVAATAAAAATVEAATVVGSRCAETSTTAAASATTAASRTRAVVAVATIARGRLHVVVLPRRTAAGSARRPGVAAPALVIVDEVRVDHLIHHPAACILYILYALHRRSQLLLQCTMG
jgi:hypothetical protein